MPANNTVDSIPKLTFGEGALGGVLFVSALTNPATAAVPIVLMLAQGAFYLVRRTPEFQAWAEKHLDASEEYDENFLRNAYEGTLKRLPVPPARTRLALPAPAGSRPQRAETPSRPSATGGIAQTLLQAFGDDNPLDRVREPASSNIDTPPGRPRKAAATREIRLPEGSVTRQLQAPDPDDAWLHKHAGEAPKASGRVMPIRELCELLNDDERVDDKPHVILFGDTGSGKTTLAQLIVGTRPGKVVILDPKRPRGWKGPKWGGLPYVCPDEEGSYKPLVLAMAAIVREMDARYRALETMSEPPEQLTVVLDEAPDCVAASPELATLYQKIVRKGREAFVRLILLSTTDRVKPLGFEGQGDLMNSLADIRLGQFAADVKPDIIDQSDLKYEWAVYAQGGWRPFNNSRTLELTEKLTLKPSKAWTGIQYNCQVAKRPAAPRQAMQSLRPVVAAEVATPPAVPGADLLDELMQITPRIVKHNLGEVVREVPCEAGGEVNSLPSFNDGTSCTSDALIGTFKSQLIDAARVYKGASLEEREALRRALEIFTSGASKTAAIKQAFGTSGGKTFIRASRLFDAAALLRRTARGG